MIQYSGVINVISMGSFSIVQLKATPIDEYLVVCTFRRLDQLNSESVNDYNTVVVQ